MWERITLRGKEEEKEGEGRGKDETTEELEKE